MKQLLCLHGALATKDQFAKLIPTLEGKINADAINFSGHGGFSIPAKGYTFEQFSEDILAYADQHKIEKINLFGFSMGGYVALFFASRHPERVNKIMTLNVKFNWDPASTAKETAMLNAEKMIEKVPGYANQLMMQHGLNLWKQVLDSTSGMMNDLSKNILLTEEDYNKITCPVLLGIGDRDFTSSVEETLAVFRKLKSASFWVLPNTSHPFEKINTNEVANEIMKFFAE